MLLLTSVAVTVILSARLSPYTMSSATATDSATFTSSIPVLVLVPVFVPDCVFFPSSVLSLLGYALRNRLFHRDFPASLVSSPTVSAGAGSAAMTVPADGSATTAASNTAIILVPIRLLIILLLLLYCIIPVNRQTGICQSIALFMIFYSIVNDVNSFCLTLGKRA